MKVMSRLVLSLPADGTGPGAVKRRRLQPSGHFYGEPAAVRFICVRLSAQSHLGGFSNRDAWDVSENDRKRPMNERFSVGRELFTSR